MQLEDIRRCGRQILEALKMLQDKGFPYGSLKKCTFVCHEIA
jgi:hypothetical protein